VVVSARPDILVDFCACAATAAKQTKIQTTKKACTPALGSQLLKRIPHPLPATGYP
jgi:hypothetical protein